MCGCRRDFFRDCHLLANETVPPSKRSKKHRAVLLRRANRLVAVAVTRKAMEVSGRLGQVGATMRPGLQGSAWDGSREPSAEPQITLAVWMT